LNLPINETIAMNQEQQHSFDLMLRELPQFARAQENMIILEGRPTMLEGDAGVYATMMIRFSQSSIVIQSSYMVENDKQYRAVLLADVNHLDRNAVAREHVILCEMVGKALQRAKHVGDNRDIYNVQWNFDVTALPTDAETRKRIDMAYKTLEILLKGYDIDILGTFEQSVSRVLLPWPETQVSTIHPRRQLLNELIERYKIQPLGSVIKDIMEDVHLGIDGAPPFILVESDRHSKDYRLQGFDSKDDMGGYLEQGSNAGNWEPLLGIDLDAQRSEGICSSWSLSGYSQDLKDIFRPMPGEATYVG
jgi:hypothetical protein